MNEHAHAASVPRTLRLKVRPESYAWLNAAAVEVNWIWNLANETSAKAAHPYAGKPRWLSGFDLNNLAAGASPYFAHIGADTIQRINCEYALKRRQLDAVRDWWLCLPVLVNVEPTMTPRAAVGLDLGLKDTVVTSDGERLEAGRFYRGIECAIAQAQRRGHKRQAKRLHRRAANRRKDALHKFSRRIVDHYQNIIVGDVSSTKLTQTRLAKSVLDAGWRMLKTQLQYKGEHAGRSVAIVNERFTTRVCSSCGCLSGPSGLRQLAVRQWECSVCGAEHDVNAARNILTAGLRCRASVRGSESRYSLIPPSSAYCVREAGIEPARAAA